MRRARRTLFASPLVVTTLAGAPACHRGGEPSRLPVVPPAPALAPRDAVVDAGARPTRKLHVHQWGVDDDVPAGTIVFVDPDCVVSAADGAPWNEVDCPEDGLPDPRPEHLVTQRGDWCFEVLRAGEERDHGEGRVRCPDGGATAAMPEVTIMPWGDSRVSIFESTLRCYHEIYANPPYWEPIAHCPPELLPRLINGAIPTDTAPCRWHEIDVQCPDPASPSTPSPSSR